MDSAGTFSEQIDVVVFDRQYSPFIFNFEGQVIIPAESVYAVFEAKQAINAEYVAYARRKWPACGACIARAADPACGRDLSCEAATRILAAC